MKNIIGILVLIASISFSFPAFANDETCPTRGSKELFEAEKKYLVVSDSYEHLEAATYHLYTIAKALATTDESQKAFLKVTVLNSISQIMVHVMAAKFPEDTGRWVSMNFYEIFGAEWTGKFQSVKDQTSISLSSVKANLLENETFNPSELSAKISEIFAVVQEDWDNIAAKDEELRHELDRLQCVKN